MNRGAVHTPVVSQKLDVPFHCLHRPSAVSTKTGWDTNSSTTVDRYQDLLVRIAVTRLA